MKQLNFSVTPDKLWQAINPWTFNGGQYGLINISLGSTQKPEVEVAILDKVGSYGRQLGWIGDALEAILAKWKHEELTEKEKDAITVLLGRLVEIREVKADS